MAIANTTLHLALQTVRRMLQLGLVGAWSGLAFGFLGRLHWTLDLCSHFYVQFVVLALIGTIAWIGSINKKVVGVALVAWLMLLPSILWLYIGPASQIKSDTRPLRVVSCNVLSSNPNKSVVIEFLKESEADMVLLMEVDAQWSQAIRTLDEIYPHQLHEAREDNFGIVLISKRPWDNAQSIRLDNSGVPSIEASFTIDGKRLRFIGTHPLPPMGYDYSTARNLHFLNLAKHVREQDVEGSTIVVGDLNCTSWSPYFSKLLRESGLRDSREGFGVQRSWPTSMKLSILGTMRIPIDHTLVSPDVSVVNRRVGLNVGSDHFPIVVDLDLGDLLFAKIQ